MSDLFSFDLQRFEDFKGETVLLSEIKGLSSTASEEGFYWGSTSLISGTVQGEVVLSVNGTTSVNASGSAYYLIDEVTAIEFPQTYIKADGASGTNTSVSAAFTNFSAGVGTSIAISSEVPLTLSGIGDEKTYTFSSLTAVRRA